jgi:predicted dehydrogenase
MTTRRHFVGTTALAATAAGLGAGPDGRLKVALVGTGERGTASWGRPLVREYADVAQLVGLCDINSKRAQASRELIGTSAPVFSDFDRMVRETRPDAVIVTTIDATHWRYVDRAMELGADVITEKPLCTDEAQCQAILDTHRRTGRRITVAFNARHGVDARRVKLLLLEKCVGDVISVDFHEYLDTSHGADYFRRWHHLKENSGTLLCHKASHHFDQVNWWLDSRPVEVSAWGELRFYGRNHSFRGTHCRSCPFRDQCAFQWDLSRNPEYVKLYAECESEDGYLRDACVWRESTNIYDTMSVRVRYETGVLLTYTASTYLPYEGQSISFNGTKGRLESQAYGGGGFRNEELRLTRSFGRSEVVRDRDERLPGAHGGADTSIRNLIFRGQPASDPLGLRADVTAGALSSLIGIAAYRSIERAGEPVRISDLARV